jgi:sugar phosphate isomerase/epimerase
VEDVIETLRGSRYRGWYAIEQDVRLAADEDKPMPGIKRALDYVRRLVTA